MNKSKKLYFSVFLVFKLVAGPKEINNLKLFEVFEQRFAPQIFMQFTKPLYFEKSVEKDKLMLHLVFPGMSLKDFEKHDIITKIKRLRDYVKDVNLFYKLVPSPRVVLSITFFREDVLVRWNKLEDPDRLILDIFLKSSLKRNPIYHNFCVKIF